MGKGGLSFLNKKSWHTSTIANTEKVWLAEQKNAEETKRVQTLQKEIEEERQVEQLRALQRQHGILAVNSVDRVDWMYRSVEMELEEKEKEKDEYLLGNKKVDSLDTIAVQGVKPSEALQATGAARWLAKNENRDIDAASRIREDPMVKILEAQRDARLSVVKNPIKMKKLRKEVELIKQIKKAEKKKRKNERKEEKRREKKILKANNAHEEENERAERSRIRHSHEETQSREVSDKIPAEESCGSRRKSLTRSSRTNNEDRYGLLVPRPSLEKKIVSSHSDLPRLSSSSSYRHYPHSVSSTSKRKHSRSRSPSRDHSGHNRSSKFRRRSPSRSPRRSVRRRSRSPSLRAERSDTASTKPSRRRIRHQRIRDVSSSHQNKMTPAERENRLREMKGLAKDQHEERLRQLAIDSVQQQKEETALRLQTDTAAQKASFITKMKEKSYLNSDERLEDRISTHKHYRQKGNTDDHSFLSKKK